MVLIDHGWLSLNPDLVIVMKILPTFLSLDVMLYLPPSSPLP